MQTQPSVATREIAWVSDSGRAIKVTVTDYCGSPCCSVYVDGKYADSGLYAVPDKPHPKDAVGVFARSVGAAYAIGLVAVRPENASLILAAVADLQAEIDARPETRIRKLRAVRDEMFARRSALLDEERAIVNAAHDSEFVAALSRAYTESRKLVAAADAITAQVAEFDQRHPDVIEAIEKERNESIARNAWN